MSILHILYMELTIFSSETPPIKIPIYSTMSFPHKAAVVDIKE